jgi:PASTA domain
VASSAFSPAYLHTAHAEHTTHTALQPCQATVPNLINRTEDEARQTLATVGLGLGSDPPGNNRVVSQVPVAGTRVLCGWLVTVTVDQPPPPPLVEVPAAADPPPALVVPPPVVIPPAAPVSRIEPFPWFWPVIIALLLPSAALLLLLLLLLAVRARKGPKWVRAHVRAVPGAAPNAGIEVRESRTDHSAPPCVVRLESHADSSQQVLEVVGQ